MARVPKIDSPCPINRPRFKGATDHCSHCDRTVHNLNLMSDRERREFMSGCSGKVCVAYTVRIPVSRIPVRARELGAAALAAAALAALPAAAESPAETVEMSDAMSPMPGTSQFPNCDSYYEYELEGGVSFADQAEWVDDGKEAPPDLPTMEDDGH